MASGTITPDRAFSGLQNSALAMTEQALECVRRTSRRVASKASIQNYHNLVIRTARAA
jgi:hypothetical protein